MINEPSTMPAASVVKAPGVISELFSSNPSNVFTPVESENSTKLSS